MGLGTVHVFKKYSTHLHFSGLNVGGRQSVLHNNYMINYFTIISTALVGGEGGRLVTIIVLGSLRVDKQVTTEKISIPVLEDSEFLQF